MPDMIIRSVFPFPECRGQVQASIVNGNGTLNRAGNGYIAHPTTIGKDVVIRVTASVGGRTQSMGIILIVCASCLILHRL